jgi:hypothetical protein
VSTLGFNLQNTIETINAVKEVLEKKPAKSKPEVVKRTTETWLQLFNPFRILLKLTFTPLLLVFFLGHLISIGLTADRMPGIPAIVSALLGMISEGFEDFHYFFDLQALIKPFAITFKIISSPFQAIGYLVQSIWKKGTNASDAPNHQEVLKQLSSIFSEGFIEAFSTTETNTSDCKDKEASCCSDGHQHAVECAHHHEHSALPNQILELAFSPLFALSALWHWAFQDPSATTQKTFKECFYLQIGWPIENPEDDLKRVENASDSTWLKTESLFALKEKINSLDQEWLQKKLAQTKKQHLQTIYDAASAPNATLDSVTNAYSEDAKRALSTHRFFKVGEKTDSQSLVESIVTNEKIFHKAPVVTQSSPSLVEASGQKECATSNCSCKPMIRQREKTITYPSTSDDMFCIPCPPNR